MGRKAKSNALCNILCKANSHIVCFTGINWRASSAEKGSVWYYVGFMMDLRAGERDELRGGLAD